MDSDVFNYAIFCWKDMDGYEEIRKNALVNRQKTKSFKDKKDSNSVKLLRQKYAMK